MANTPITERQIHVYSCVTDPARKCVSIIDGWPMIFKGETPLRARKAADEWRREAVRNDKLIPKLRKMEMLGEPAP